MLFLRKKPWKHLLTVKHEAKFLWEVGTRWSIPQKIHSTYLNGILAEQITREGTALLDFECTVLVDSHRVELEVLNREYAGICH